MKWLTQWAVTSAVLILIVLAARYLLREKLSARWRYALWAVVLVRLLVPFQVALPARSSDALPLLVSNVVPEVADVELYALRTDSYEFPQGSQAMQEAGLELGEVFSIGHTYHNYGWIEVEYDHHFGVLTETGWDTYLFRFTLPQLLTGIWTAGAVLLALILLVSNLRFALQLRKRRKVLEVPDVPLRVYTAEGLPSPCLFGVFRPAVYVTPGAAEDPDALRHVLAHELTHYTHKDHIWSLLRCLALALHWYDPLVWLAVALSKRDGELACDEGAVARLGEEERIPYGRTLVDMVAQRSRPADLLSCSTAMTDSGKSIQERVARLVKRPKTVKAALFAAAAVVALSVVFVFAERGQPDRTPRDLLDQVEQATAIRYCPPLYSNTIYPDPITDETLLAEAKEALSGFRYLEIDDPQPVLDLRNTMHISRIVLTVGSKQMDYSLLWQNDYTYLLPGDIFQQGMDLKEEEGEDARLEGVFGTCISARGDDVISTLRRLASGQSQSDDPDPGYRTEGENQWIAYGRSLTPEEIDQVKEAFQFDIQLPDGSWGPSEISCFFTSSYDDPTQIDLKEFLRYCPLAEEVTKEQAPKEYRKILEISWAEEITDPDFLMPVPVWRYPREKVSALLQKYAGVTVEELDWSGCLYVEEYDAFYNFTSDYGPGFFPCTGGQITGDTVLLWSDPDENGDRCELTLRKDGDRWLIRSHHTIYTR